jgi:ribonuclease Z
LGVPFGPERSKLTKGESVTVKVKVDGQFVERVVQPEECIGESETPVVSDPLYEYSRVTDLKLSSLQAVLVLDIPTKAHILPLLSAFDTCPFYAKFRSTRPEDIAAYVVRSVFHICGDGVLEDERYIAFMNGFASSVHVSINGMSVVCGVVSF